MSQKLSQATLNTYWDYDNPVIPTVYERQSDMQFLVLQNTQNSGYGQEVYFTTPATYSPDATLRSTDGLLNACGYFVEYGPDTSFTPTTLTGSTTKYVTHYRYRLMQGLEPTENLALYANPDFRHRVSFRHSGFQQFHHVKRQLLERRVLARDDRRLDRPCLDQHH